MKVLMINSVCGIRSTGRICTDLAQELEKQGHKVKIAYGRENVPKEFQKYAIRIGNDIDIKIHGLKARLFDQSGFGSKRATKKFIKWVKEYNPDIIHLHNLHGYYINIKVLFDYLKKSNKKVIWTLHDCWSFTGHCAYFDYVGCNKWKKECRSCPQRKEYPKSFIDFSNRNWKKKKKIFSGVKNLTIITPSNWLANIVKESFLSNYSVKVIHNGIDTNIFKPTKSDITKKYGIEDKKVVLGVAAVWDRRKGLKYMLELASQLDDSYKVVIIGVTEKQRNHLPKNIIGISSTNNIKELVEWYSSAEVYVNTTLEDNYPTTNLEAIACGTPVITFDTGGSPESATYFGYVIRRNNVKLILKAIHIQLENKVDINEISQKATCKLYLQLYQQSGGIKYD